MKLAYKQTDGSSLTKEDMSYVLAHMPFTSDECESKVSHRILIDELRNQNPHLMSADMQPKAINALKAIKQHVAEQGETPEVQILSIESLQTLQTMNI